MKYAITAAAGLALAAGASADYSFNFAGPVELANGASAMLFSGNLSGGAIGFNYDFFYDEPAPGDSSWASDMLISITAANGNTVTIGGYDNPGLAVPYQGAASGDPGTYGANIDISAFGLGGSGLWTVSITNDGPAAFDPDPNIISNFNGMLVGDVVPTPGALGLFGLAGLAATRRRR